MGEIVRKQVCECTNCGNEAEMVITCSLPDDVDTAPTGSQSKPASTKETTKQVKGVAKCSLCGNEADMWIDF